MAQQLKERIDNWDYMKLKIFCTTKEMVSKLKRLPTHKMGENLCQLYIGKGIDNQNKKGSQKTKHPKNQ
jgi:hypothetical protein